MKLIRKSIFLLLLLPCYSFAQKNEKNPIDTGWDKVHRNIVRVVLSQPMFPDYETNGILAGQYERKIQKKITGLAKLGFGVTADRFGPPENPHRSGYHLFSALEARYYYSLDRRVRKMRPIVNYTGPYVSIETSLITNKIISINPTPAKPFFGSIGSYLNIGYQKQAGKFYIGGSIGALLWGKRFSTYDDYAASLHGNVGVGYVF